MALTVVYDYQAFYNQEYGGISRYFYELARRVSESDGFSVEVIAPFYINAYLRQGGVRVTGRKLEKENLTRVRRHLGWLVNEFISLPLLWSRRPQVLHETYYRRRSFPPPGSATVVTVHDMIHEKFYNNSPRRDRLSKNKYLAVTRADHVICISENTRNDLIGLSGISREKTSVIPDGVSRFPSKTGQVPLAAKERPYLLYVGSRDRYKNFQNLLHAYANSGFLKQHFALVCFGGGVFAKQEYELLSELGVTSRQVFQVSGDDAMLAALYYNAVAFVYPSLYEGFGLSLLEAMSCDCPVSCSNTSAFPEVVGNAAAMFDPHDPDSIRDVLERLLSSDDARRTLICLGRKRISHFSWDRCAEETKAVYRKVV